MSTANPDRLAVAMAQASEPDPADGATDGPGVLRGSAWLTLQTRHAGRLVRGRPRSAGKPPIVGLLGFADGLRRIRQGAQSDDPYAPLVAPEIEYAVIDGLGLELELPFEEDGLASVKVAAQ